MISLESVRVSVKHLAIPIVEYIMPTGESFPDNRLSSGYGWFCELAEILVFRANAERHHRYIIVLLKQLIIFSIDNPVNMGEHVISIGEDMLILLKLVNGDYQVIFRTSFMCSRKCADVVKTILR